MRYKESWKMEHMVWANPADGFDVFNKAIGSTTDQLQKATGRYACVWQYEAPAKVLRFIDPFFEPREGSIPFFEQALAEGRSFAPPQVWISVEDFASFPKNSYYAPQEIALRRLALAGIKKPTYSDLTREEMEVAVRKHEGRNRLWFAHQLGETVVPVQVWLPRVDPKVEEARYAVQTMQRQLEEKQADIEYLEERLYGAKENPASLVTADSLGFKRLGDGFYQSRDGRFQIIRTELRDGDWWYWRDTVKGQGGDDIFLRKREAIEALIDYLMGRIEGITP